MGSNLDITRWLPERYAWRGLVFVGVVPAGSANGFTYNFGRKVAASFAPLIGFLGGAHPLSSAMAGIAFGSFACVIPAVLLLPGTLGRQLVAVVASNDAAGGLRGAYPTSCSRR